jgi:hypothetical protein
VLLRTMPNEMCEVIFPVDYQESGVIVDDVRSMSIFVQEIRLIVSSGNT